MPLSRVNNSIGGSGLPSADSEEKPVVEFIYPHPSAKARRSTFSAFDLYPRRLIAPPTKQLQRQRIASALLALMLLVALSTFVIVAQSAALHEPPARGSAGNSRAFPDDDHTPDIANLDLDAPPESPTYLSNRPHHHTIIDTTRHRKLTKKFRKLPGSGVAPPALTLSLNLAQELAAVTNFLASLPSNVLPPTVDPARPIDPQLVLDFQLDATDELRAMVRDVWARNPVFLYSKVYSPASRELKSIFTSLYLLPAPTILEVDIRDDAEILTPMLKRLSGFPELPVLIIGGTPVGSLVEVKALKKSGELLKMIKEAGALVNGAKKKKKGR